MAVSIHDTPDTPPADETTQVFEASQWRQLAGLTPIQALAVAYDSSWFDRIVFRTVRSNESCPWGYSWYRENPETGKLELWRHHWDSSG